MVYRRFHKRKQLYSCDRNHPGEVQPRARVSIAFGVSSEDITQTFPVPLPLMVTDMNAGPFEHAEPAMILVELLHGNLPEHVSGVC